MPWIPFSIKSAKREESWRDSGGWNGLIGGVRLHAWFIKLLPDCRGTLLSLSVFITLFFHYFLFSSLDSGFSILFLNYAEKFLWITKLLLKTTGRKLFMKRQKELSLSSLFSIFSLSH